MKECGDLESSWVWFLAPSLPSCVVSELSHNSIHLLELLWTLNEILHCPACSKRSKNVSRYCYYFTQEVEAEMSLYGGVKFWKIVMENKVFQTEGTVRAKAWGKRVFKERWPAICTMHWGSSPSNGWEGLVMAGVDGQSWKAKESDLGR